MQISPSPSGHSHLPSWQRPRQRSNVRLCAVRSHTGGDRTLVPDSSYHGETDISSDQLCPHISMTVADLGAVFGYDAASPVATWADPRFSCSNSLTLGSIGVTLAANDDPSMANYALMSLLDSDTTAKGYFTAGLTNAFTHNSATTEDTTPSETWPYAGPYVIAGGDDPFIGKLLTINASNNVPSNEAANWVLGAAFPVSSVWTGAPLGAPWNIPTAAVQNAQGSFVTPSTGSATASEKDATLAATSDPTTNNLVTFNATASDASAYNSYLMEESYLVVPTSGETAAKDTALAALIRFVLGPKGQTDIESFGAAPRPRPWILLVSWWRTSSTRRPRRERQGRRRPHQRQSPTRAVPPARTRQRRWQALPVHLALGRIRRVRAGPRAQVRTWPSPGPPPSSRASWPARC